MNGFYLDKHLSAYSDEKLAQLVKDGNHDAFSVLSGRYLPYIKAKASSFHALGFEDSDFIQEGLLSLFVCTGAYNENRNTGFKTFTESCILRRMISLYRSAAASKNIPLSSYLSLDDNCADIPQMGSDPEQLLIDDECFNELKDKIVSSLSDFEYSVLNCYLNDISYQEIADRLNTSTKAVNNALQRIRVKLRSLL